MEERFIVSIEKDADGSYVAYNVNGDGFVLIGRGGTVGEAKADFAKSMEGMAESEMERHGRVPGILTAEPEYKLQTSVRQVLDDIYEEVNWAYLAKNYFGKSRSWLYHKLDGIDGNKKPTDFTPEERQRLKGALCDLADRIRRAAAGIQ